MQTKERKRERETREEGHREELSVQTSADTNLERRATAVAQTIICTRAIILELRTLQMGPMPKPREGRTA